MKKIKSKIKTKSNPKTCAEVGGQAVIEGVMMKSKTKLSISVRVSPKKIVNQTQKTKPRKNVFKWPFLL